VRRSAAVFLVAVGILTAPLGAAEETFTFGRFGAVTAYYKSLMISRVVLFISGDGGWNRGVVDMARAVASLDALVVGVDIRAYMKSLLTSSETCAYPAGDLEQLSQFVQKKYRFPDYFAPVIMGYSSGATFVYAALVQAPSNTFRGGISLGFCPDLVSPKSFCPGNGLEWKEGGKPHAYMFLPAGTLEVPWIVLQGAVDKVCDPSATAEFVRQVPNGELVDLPKVGHGFAMPRNWLPQFKDAFDRIAVKRGPEPASLDPDLGDLPLIEVPSPGSTRRILAVHITGDGGWGVTDAGLAKGLAADGIPVAGLSSLKYFWARQTPESAATDLERILKHYLRAWDKDEAVVIGYSFGADALPFMYNRLTEETRARVRLLVLMGPSAAANFEIRISSLLGRTDFRDNMPTLPEIEKIPARMVLCFYGEEDKTALSGTLASRGIRSVPIRSGHRFGRNFQPIVDAILEELGPRPD
jgi:type IV secretory pathway VirJ component